MLQERQRDIRMAMIAGQHEERVARLVAKVRRQAHRQKLAELGGLAPTRVAEDATGESEGVVVQSRPGLVLLQDCLPGLVAGRDDRMDGPGR